MLEKSYVIAGGDVYPSGDLRPSALMKYMQQMAREDCDALGCTYAFMRDNNTVFVLTKTGLEFFRPIKAGETVTVRTLNNDIDGIIFDREYEIFVGDIEVAHASTFWVLIRYDTRTLVRPKDFPFEFTSYHKDCYAVEVPRRISADGLTVTEERRVRVSDLDENNHLNNCVYADIALDSVDGFDGLNASVKAIKMIFRHEARLGDRLEVLSAANGDGVIVTAVNKTSGKPCFESEVTFFSAR